VAPTTLQEERESENAPLPSLDTAAFRGSPSFVPLPGVAALDTHPHTMAAPTPTTPSITARAPAPDAYHLADLSDEEGCGSASGRAGGGGASAGLTGAAAAAAGLGEPGEPAGPGMTALSGEGWALEVTQYPGFLCRVVSRVSCGEREEGRMPWGKRGGAVSNHEKGGTFFERRGAPPGPLGPPDSRPAASGPWQGNWMPARAGLNRGGRCDRGAGRRKGLRLRSLPSCRVFLCASASVCQALAPVPPAAGVAPWHPCASSSPRVAVCLAG